MANQIGKTHWTLDTVGVISTAPVYITSIQWVGDGTTELGDGDICQLQDKLNGTDIFYRKLTGVTEGAHQGFPGGLRVDGLYLAVLGNGHLIITLKTS
jgi:hypothetical protein